MVSLFFFAAVYHIASSGLVLGFEMAKVPCCFIQQVS